MYPEPPVSAVRGMSNTSVVDKQSSGQVPEQMDRQEKVIASLHSLLSSLEERLNSVTTKEPATACKAPQPDVPYSLLSEKIAKHNGYIQGVCDRVQELLRLLQL